MPMSIVLSDQSEQIVRARIKNFPSPEAVVDTALSMLDITDDCEDPEYREYVKRAIAEAETDTDPPKVWKLEEVKARLHEEWARSQTCHT
ncbi:MAG: hypothetical protein HQL96_13325 [Magnetococcales bacterium]|nr:hypothetical protein [Magnetococcales bacterium]